MNELTSVQNFSESFASGDLRAALWAVGREFHSRGWSLGTSSNYSVVAGRNPLETLLHCLIAGSLPDVGAILHTHSIWGTILSRQALATQQTRGAIQIQGYEMLKGLEGITTHDTTINVPVFQNSQDMVELSDRIREVLISSDGGPSEVLSHHGFLLSGHGLYTWGRTLAEARRHIEIFEFLFEVTAQQKLLARCT